MIKDYFSHYSNNEQRIINKWLNSDWLKDKVESAMPDNTGYHDAIIKLKDGTSFNASFFVEVKEDEKFWFNKTGNIGLDYLSSFNFKNKADKDKYRNNWVRAGQLQQFKTDIEISKKGKLFTCDAEVQLYYVKDEFLQAYDNQKLQDVQFVKYLETTYDLRINDKTAYGIQDNWQSAAYFVNPKKDNQLQECEINNFDELINAIKSKMS